MKYKNFIKKNSENIILSFTILFLIIVLASLVYILTDDNSKDQNNDGSNNVELENNFNIETSAFTEIEKCMNLGTEKNNCYIEFVNEYAQGKTIKDVLRDLEIARTQNTAIENDCHPMTHAIGRYALDVYGNVGDAFQECDFTCHSGCYHGVMERMFFSEEEIKQGNKHLTYEGLEAKVPGICDKSNFDNPTVSIIFQCLHGIGHAILFSVNYDLELALSGCDLLSTQYDRSSCYGGVFMENVTAFEKDKRDLDPNDALYPCSKLDKKYLSDCYLMQTSIMFEYNLNHGQIAEECKKAGDFVSTCFVSLGRDSSNMARTGNARTVADICERVSVDYSIPCIQGTIYALIDNTWDGQFAFPFCNILQNKDNRDGCYNHSVNYLKNTYQKSEDEVKVECEKYAGENKELCKYYI